MHRNAFSITRRFGAGPGKWQHRPTRLQHLRFLATRQEPDTGKAPLEHTNANKEFLVKNDSNANGVEEQNGLSRRLEQYTEEALCENPRFMKAAVASGEFDFNKELKQKLLDRIASADFNSKNAQALATASLPAFAGKGTMDTAMAKPWTGEESQEDTTLRMLTDAHKPLRGNLARRPDISRGANKDLRPTPRVNKSPSQRLAHARDLSSEYTLVKDLGLSEEESRQQVNIFMERFQPAGRPVATINALTSLADQRIEEARARGQFKNLPRGKPLEKDHNADSPFLNTTEYLLNRIIKKQEIVPPWIEKQQELNRARDVFRTRLRVEWKRHVVRVISSQGGSIKDQVSRATRYAAAERAVQASVNESRDGAKASPVPASGPRTLVPAGLQPFRDPTWLETEYSYHTLAVENLNKLTRAYNLMAPELAKKPYFSLERELNACYMEVASQLGEELVKRGTTSSVQEVSSMGLWKKKVTGTEARVYAQKPAYGFKEFWRDLFSRQKPNSPDT